MKITSQRIEVMVWWLLLILPLSTATLCRTGLQFWNETLGKCIDCTNCTQTGELVLRPCQIHQDTVCGPFASLDIDWSFLGRTHKHHRRLKQSSSEINSDSDGKDISSVESSENFVTNRTKIFSSEEFEKDTNKKPHHKKWPHRGKHHHKKHQSHNHNKTRSHQHHHHHKFEWSSSEILPESSNSSEFEDTFGWTSSSEEHHEVSFSSRKSKHSHNHHKNSSKSYRHRPESASQLKELEPVTNLTAVRASEPHRAGTSAPFSATEELVWDWQAVALGLAVFACMFFFLVACVYSVHHARQWRRLKDHFEDFEADVGELSTRLSLLLPTLQNEERGPVSPDCCANSSQCLYLEKLLARKQQEEEGSERGNVYIDRDIVSVHRA